MKKLLAMVLALVLVLSASASALTYTEAGYPIADEIINLEVAGQEPSYPDHDWNDSIFVTEIENRLGIHLHYTPYTHDAWQNQMTLMFATDDLPDIIANLQNGGNMPYGQALKYGDEGYLLDFSQYLDKMPFLTEFFGNHPEYQAYVTTQTGAIYGFPIFNVQGKDSLSVYPVSWDMDALAAIGAEIPQTREELYNVLAALKEQYPDNVIYGGSPKLTDNMQAMIKWGFGIYSRDTEGYDLCVDDEGKVYLAELNPEFKDFVAYMKSLVDLGIFDEDYAVRTNDEGKERILNNNYMVLGNAYDNTYEALQAERGMEVKNWLPTNHAFVANEGDEKVTVLKNPVYPNFNFVGYADSEYPEAVARFLDYFFDEFGEGGDSALNGWAGSCFTPMEVMGTGITMFDVEEQRGDMDAWEYRSSVACWYQAFAAMFCKVNSNWLVYDYVENKDDLLTMWQHCSIGNGNNWRAYCNEEDGLTWKTSMGPLPYTDEEATRRSTLVTDIKGYIATMYANFMTGEADIETEYDGFIEQLKTMGAEELVAIEQAAYDRMNG